MKPAAVAPPVRIITTIHFATLRHRWSRECNVAVRDATGRGRASVADGPSEPKASRPSAGVPTETAAATADRCKEGQKRAILRIATGGVLPTRLPTGGGE